jgi:hypothetical protein
VVGPVTGRKLLIGVARPPCRVSSLSETSGKAVTAFVATLPYGLPDGRSGVRRQIDSAIARRSTGRVQAYLTFEQVDRSARDPDPALE